MPGRTSDFLLILLTLFLCFVGSGCDTNENTKKVSLKDIQEASLNTTPEKTPLRVAIGAIISPKETFYIYKDLLNYISERIAIPTQLIQRETYAEINELVKSGNLDLAFVCTGAYVDGNEEFGMELLVAPEAYGESVYYSYIIANVDSDISSLEELRGKRFAFTDPMSNTGRLAPIYMLTQMQETPDSFFNTHIYTYSHDRSITAVAKNLVDGAAVDSLVWEYMDATDSEFTKKTRIIKKSEAYAIPPVVVPVGLDPELKKQLRNIFLAIHLDEEGKRILSQIKIDKFVLINDNAYDLTRKMKAWVEENAAN